MKIDFAGNDLSGAGRMAGPKDYDCSTDRRSQKSDGIRAVQQKVFDRLNAATTISFSVTREHSTVVEAENFSLTHESTLPNNGLLTLTCFDGSAVVKVSYLANAQLDSVRIKFDGQLTFTSYHFTGGRLTVTKPKTTP